MDRRVVFVRHVSSPHPSGVSDFDRPIDEEGREDAARVVKHLAENGWLPERVVVSAARRAEETWEAMAEATDRGREDLGVTSTRELYGAGIDDICEVIWGLDAETAETLLIGHNPGFSDVVSWLSGVRSRLPKGGIAVIRCEGDDWSEAVQQRSGQLEAFVRPAELIDR